MNTPQVDQNQSDIQTRNRFEGRVALVTGGSGGIGRALVLALAADGAAVAVGYGSHAAAAEQLAAEIVAAGGRAIAAGADLRQPDAPGTLVATVEAALGPIDVLVNNAGIGRIQSFEDVRSEDFDEVLAVNLRAPFLLAQRTVPGMRERRFGRILFISSTAAFIGGIVGPHYAASKAGIHGLTHFFAGRLAPFGITVNALAPALIAETGMFLGDPQQLAQRVPIGRLGRPEEVADMALAMLRNPYLTNQVYALDGGIHPRQRHGYFRSTMSRQVDRLGVTRVDQSARRHQDAGACALAGPCES